MSATTIRTRPHDLQACAGKCEGYGYYFEKCDNDWLVVRCETCEGTGRTSLLSTALRVPQWLLTKLVPLNGSLRI